MGLDEEILKQLYIDEQLSLQRIGLFSSHSEHLLTFNHRGRHNYGP